MTFHPPAPFRFVGRSAKNGDMIQFRITYRPAAFGTKDVFELPDRAGLAQTLITQAAFQQQIACIALRRRENFERYTLSLSGYVVPVQALLIFKRYGRLCALLSPETRFLTRSTSRTLPARALRLSSPLAGAVSIPIPKSWPFREKRTFSTATGVYTCNPTVTSVVRRGGRARTQTSSRRPSRLGRFQPSGLTIHPMCNHAALGHWWNSARCHWFIAYAGRGNGNPYEIVPHEIGVTVRDLLRAACHPDSRWTST